MTRGRESKRNSMEINGLIQVRHGTPLHESVSETVGKVVEREKLIWMTRGTGSKCGMMKVNGLIQVR